MADRRTLALVARPETVSRLPADALVLPIRPNVAVPADRLLVSRPEALLDPAACKAIDDRAARVAREWSCVEPIGEAFAWRGQNLAECFAYEFRLVATDVFKAAELLQAAAGGMSPGAIAADIPPASVPFPPYPYLEAIGTLSKGLARRLGVPFHDFSRRHGPTTHPSGGPFSHAYGRMAARQSVAILQKKRPLIAVGPHPEFYSPVARAWRRVGGSTVVVTSAAVPVRAQPRSGLYLLPIEALAGAEDRRRIQAFADRAVSSIDALSTRRVDGDAADAFAILRSHLVGRARRDLRMLAAAGLAFERGLERAEHVLLVETVSPLSKAMARYAKACGLCVTVLQHGVIAGEFGYLETEGDRVAAWGRADADWFGLRLGPSVQVEATGCPRYDGMPGDVGSETMPPESGAVRTVLFASQPYVQDLASRSPWDRHDIVRTVLEGIRAVPGSRLVVKWHPSEPGDALPDAATDAKARRLHSARTLDLLRDAHVVLAISSTVALEAMFLQRPVVFIGPRDPASPFHPPEDGAGLRAIDVASLERILRSLLSDPEARERVLAGQREFLTRSYAPLDGHAAERIVSFLRRR